MPILVGVFAGGGVSSGYLVPLLLVVCVVAHVAMMFKGHGGAHEENEADASKEKKEEHRGCH
ncbi:MAG: DUF2933 domain-containing protein [Candidatus Harrisonbacteria bacterium]|nr:DUF2933 domain-containing protein [Candidatus Harrisonbacteria bacterium]